MTAQAETAEQKVARVRAEMAAKRAGAAAPAVAAVQTSPIPAVAQASVPAPAAAPTATAPVDEFTHIPGMTAAVWTVLAPDTKKAVLAQYPAPAAAPAAPPAPVAAAPQAPPAAPPVGTPLYSQQTAPINPPDMLGGTTPPAAPEPPTAGAEQPAKKGRGRPAVKDTAADAPAAADGTAERIATALETIAGLLEILVTK